MVNNIYFIQNTSICSFDLYIRKFYKTGYDVYCIENIYANVYTVHVWGLDASVVQNIAMFTGLVIWSRKDCIMVNMAEEPELTMDRPIKYEPSTVNHILTEPIRVLAEKPKTETRENFDEATRRMFAGSLSLDNPITPQSVEAFLDTGALYAKEVKATDGYYANTPEGPHAEALLIMFAGAKEVVNGTRKDPRHLVDLVNIMAKKREEAAIAELGDAGRQGLGISREGRIVLRTGVNQTAEKNDFKQRLDRVQRENSATQTWVTKTYGEPKNSW